MDFNLASAIQISIVTEGIEYIDTIPIESVLDDGNMYKIYLPFGFLNIEKEKLVWDDELEEFSIGSKVTIQLIE